jgi:hypothetical protein
MPAAKSLSKNILRVSYCKSIIYEGQVIPSDHKSFDCNILGFLRRKKEGLGWI